MPLLTNINEVTLSDGSKVYDCIVYDYEQVDGEDRLCIACQDERAAIDLSLIIENAVEKYGI